jgi:hypothetical protein
VIIEFFVVRENSRKLGRVNVEIERKIDIIWSFEFDYLLVIIW